jgi:hypothetical protein
VILPDKAVFAFSNSPLLILVVLGVLGVLGILREGTFLQKALFPIRAGKH